MAEATSYEACIERHQAYAIDIAGRLRGRQGERLRRMLAPVQPGERVLDVGCNSGYLADYLPQCECYGVDVCAELVARARSRMVDAVVAPAEVLPYPSRAMDVVVLGEILEHVYEPIEVVAEASRVARRLVVGSTPHEDGKWGTRTVQRHAYHVRCFTEPWLREVLGLHLRDVSIENVLGQFYVFRGSVA